MTSSTLSSPFGQWRSVRVWFAMVSLLKVDNSGVVKIMHFVASVTSSWLFLSVSGFDGVASFGIAN